MEATEVMTIENKTCEVKETEECGDLVFLVIERMGVLKKKKRENDDG